MQKAGENLLIGTDGLGAYVWDGKNKIHLIPETQNLIVNHIYKKGNEIWMATQKGALDFTYNNDGHFKLNKVLRKTDGLVSDHINYIAIHKNKIFTSNFNGITAVDKNQMVQQPIYKIYFKSIKYNNETLHPGQVNKLLFTQNNNLNIDFGLVDYTGQEHNRYYYQLLPVQNKWVNVPTTNLNFNHLKPEDYTFKIKAINPYGQEKTASFDFTIKPLWWQTDAAKIFFVLLFLFGVSLIGYITRRRELSKQRKKLIAQKQMAEFELHALRSQMNPHFVFNSLNAILYYINDEDFDNSENYLIKFSHLIRMIFDFSRKKSIRLKQEIELLTSYLKLEKMRFGDHLDYCIQIAPELDIKKTEIPTLLLQPIVENAVNHGIFHKKDKGVICLNFKYIDKNTFEVVIQDDGVGIERSKQINEASLKKHNSRSTQILKERINLLNLSGKWHITYKFIDATQDKQNPYNTIVKLKIKKL